MTELRPFQASDTPWTLFGLAFGAFYGAMFILLIDFWGTGIFLLLLLAVPFILAQLVLNIGLDRFKRWRRREAPPPQPTAWLRHHSISIGAAAGASVILLLLLWRGPLAGSSP